MNIEEVYDAHFKDVYHFMLSLCKNHIIAEEITQETFVKALEEFDSFKGNSKINTWLCQIAKNLYFNALDKDKRLDYNRDIEGIMSDDFVHRLLDNEDALKIHRLLHTLPEPYKEIFTLRVFAELPFLQIASLFDKQESWARVVYYRAKQKIMSGLEGSQ